jgi:hypothetical protein
VTFTSQDIAGTVTVTPGADGRYGASNNTLETSLGGGEKGLFTASGGDVPAFEQAFDIPLALLLSEPVLTAGSTQVIPRASDFSLHWSRGTAGVRLFVRASSARPDGQPGSAYFTCDFPSEAGAGVIPSSILQTVSAGTSPQFYTLVQAAVTAGEYDITAYVGIGVYNEAKDQRLNPTLE